MILVVTQKSRAIRAFWREWERRPYGHPSLTLDLPFELNFVAAYGAAGSLITMLIWIYYAAQIVLFGAEFTRVYAQERGRGIRPAKHAVRVDRKEIELPPLTDRGDKWVSESDEHRVKAHGINLLRKDSDRRFRSSREISSPVAQAGIHTPHKVAGLFAFKVLWDQ